MTQKQKKLFYKSIFIIGLLSLYWGIKIYRQTVIDIKILLGIILISGIATTRFALKDFNELFGYEKKLTLIFWTFIQSTASWGFIACSIFMMTNFYLASNETQKETYRIVERSSLPGSKHHRDERKPTFKILYKGKLKELVFSHKYYEQMESFEEIELLKKEGYLGYDLLLESKLK